ncbi:MAG: diacylglycerol kinase family lipid kinase [Planctomycetales bacterium]|nr:diacylglycerol kinase family lipid kinase [Planctomycetales bacterium]
MKTCVILNPNAGTALVQEQLAEQLQRLTGLTIAKTKEPGDARRLAKEAVESSYDLVVAAGGDGTINEVLNGLATNFGQATFGILPLGTANDFARTINIPADLPAAIDILLAGQTEQIDVIRYDGAESRYFLNVSAGGFSGQVNDALTDEMKQTWGPLAYLRSAAGVLPNLTDFRTFISCDDEPEQKVHLYNIVVANARYVAGGIPIAPEAQLNDGLADIIIVPAASMLELAVLGPQILLGSHLASELVLFRRARKISVRSEPGMWFNVDGELLSNAPAHFEVLPRAIKVVVGPPPNTATS